MCGVSGETLDHETRDCVKKVGDNKLANRSITTTQNREESKEITSNNSHAINKRVGNNICLKSNSNAMGRSQ